MTSVTQVNPVDDARWDALVRRHPLGSIFHTAAWARVLISTFSYEPVYLAVVRDGEICSALPFMQISSWLTGRRLVALPRTSVCDPLVSDPRDLDLLLDAAVDRTRARHLSFLEIKTQAYDGLAGQPRLKDHAHFRNQVLPLDRPADQLWKGFDRTCVRQRITRAQKTGVTVRRGTTLADLHGFYELHRQSTAKNAVPRRPFSFFRNMWEILGPTGDMLLVLAEVGTELGSAAVFLRSGPSLVFEFLANNYALLDHSPVHLITWEMIQQAVTEGYRFFDFGMTPPGNAGLLAFKSRWGAEEHVLHYYYYPDVAGYKSYVTETGPADLGGPVARSVHRLKCSAATLLSRHFG
jgi:CelD/BcsL family acetyltransferase involved in cellulose biosynthesis